VTCAESQQKANKNQKEKENPAFPFLFKLADSLLVGSALANSH